MFISFLVEDQWSNHRTDFPCKQKSSKYKMIQYLNSCYHFPEYSRQYVYSPIHSVLASTVCQCCFDWLERHIIDQNIVLEIRGHV